MTQLVLNYEIGDSWTGLQGGSGLGSVGWDLEQIGWAGFIADVIEPALAWCDESNVTPAILLHHPFGKYYAETQRLDYHDYARAFGIHWLLEDFSHATRGWPSVASRVDVFAYLGGMDLTPALRDQPASALAATIKRCFLPLQRARFAGVVIDHAENAIPHPYGDPEAASYARRSVDTLTLKLADDRFRERAGVEAAPRAFDEFAALWDRRCVAADEEWRFRYGGFSPEQCTLYDYRPRDTNHVLLGYDRSVLTGEVWRTIPIDDDAELVRDLAQLIVAEGDVAALTPQSLIAADIPASELVA